MAAPAPADVRPSLWWVNPRLWIDAEDPLVARPCEHDALAHIRRQAETGRGEVLKLVVKLDRYYAETERALGAFARLHRVAADTGMTVYQVVDALEEATALLEEA